MDPIDKYREMPFLFLSENPDRVRHKNQFEELYRGFDNNASPLGKIFFSEENINLIQKKIILEVFKKTQNKINYQEPERLLIVMRYIFTTEAKHLQTNIKEQIRELDNLVVDTVLPDIITNVEQYLAYLKVVNGERVLLDRPEHITNRQSMQSYEFQY